METANLAETRARELVVQCCERNGVPVLTLTLAPTLTLTLTLTPTLTLTLTLTLSPTLTQVAYAGLFLAQHFAQTCRGAAVVGGRGGGGGACYKFVHDGRERCVAGGRPRYAGAGL